MANTVFIIHIMFEIKRAESKKLKMVYMYSSHGMN